VKGKGVEGFAGVSEGSVGAIPNSPQRLKSFRKRDETLKIFCLSDRREAAKDFWLSALAGRRQSQAK
jgi:hypothetical protein